MKKNKCPHCNKLLFLGDAKEIEIKCPKCKKIVTFKNQ